MLTGPSSTEMVQRRGRFSMSLRVETQFFMQAGHNAVGAIGRALEALAPELTGRPNVQPFVATSGEVRLLKLRVGEDGDVKGLLFDDAFLDRQLAAVRYWLRRVKRAREGPRTRPDGDAYASRPNQSHTTLASTATIPAVFNCPLRNSVIFGNHFGRQAPGVRAHYRLLSAAGKDHTVDLGTYAASDAPELFINLGRAAVCLPATRAGVEELRDMAGMFKQASDELSGLLQSGELKGQS